MTFRPTMKTLMAGVLTVATVSGCGFILRHTANITAPPDVEVVRLPAAFQLEPRPGASARPARWVRASSTAASHLPTGRAEAGEFDLSGFLARDPWIGAWSAPLPTEQQIFVPTADLARVMLEAGDWRERFVVQLAENQGPEPRRGTQENGRLVFDDIAHVLCPKGVTRLFISSDPNQALYESRFVKCPRFGPDRVVLTRELFGNWDMMRHSQAVYTFSYEVRGDRFTAAERAAGLKLIAAPDLVMATWDGDQHPIWRDAQLRIVTSD